MLDTPYFAKRSSRVLEIRAHAAYVLEATFKGHFVAVTVRVKGSNWAWHPYRIASASYWTQSGNRKHRNPEPYQPSRHIRKAAKMALRRWLSPL